MKHRYTGPFLIALSVLGCVYILLVHVGVVSDRHDKRSRFSHRDTKYDPNYFINETISEINREIRQNPNDANGYIKRGEANIDKGYYYRAISDCTKAIKLDPDNALAYKVRGDAHYGDDDYDKAIADYTKAIELDPDFADAYIQRGIAYPDYDKALADYTKAIELDPDDDLSYQLRGHVYSAKGDYDNAIKEFTKAIELDPEYPFTSYLFRGDAYKQKGDNVRAKADQIKTMKYLDDFVLYPDIAAVAGCLIAAMILLGLHFVDLPRSRD